MVKPVKPAKQATYDATIAATEPVRGSLVARGTVDKLLTALDEHVDVLIDELKEYNNPDKASALALLGTKISQIMGEVRKLEAAERDASAKLSPAAVATYLRGLDKAEWAQLRRETDAHHEEGGRLFR
jgi:hypothetical protein